MATNRPITDLLARSEPVISVEFFPPKDEASGEALLQTAQQLKETVNPDFVSITYGAGGTTRDRTFRYACSLKDDLRFQVMPHLTCVGSSKDELREIIGQFRDAGFCNIMALRGDPPKGETEFKPHPDGLRYASDLIALIRETASGFCLGCSGYPEKHPEAASLDADIDAVKIKVDNGASFITTQLFFDNAHYFSFVEKCRAKGIYAPVVPGLLPVLSLKQIRRFADMCGSVLPPELEQRLTDADAQGGDDAVKQIGIDWAFQQIVELFERGAPGVHLYILNRSESALELSRRLKAHLGK